MTDFVRENPLVLLIGAAEIAFWVFLVAGLTARYLLRARRLSSALLLCVPLVDVVLVTASLADVATGSPPGPVHGVAALYLGLTVAFGHSMVRWADVRFAHRFADGPPPARKPTGGPARTRYEWREFAKAAVAWVITVGVTVALAAVAGSGVPAPVRWLGDPLWSWPARATVAALIWFAVGPLWATLWPGADDREQTVTRR
ncbi:hypothetical protein [Pseudonocardia endophytica]|uniref:Uncharacterized protein n=1 Tax=Pseudonocardia endophytica TaxID=401976 RepID=A0A4R1HGW7_PSEEN|nr:hypothetical protein [Pseudonocardia endophytica]TCK20101.1 hypothetical protein EV378_4050 [Pseudonocardia endophytica]